jgi:hypothetical protein
MSRKDAMRQNTLNLVGDGDELDMIRDVERTFGMTVAKDEARGLYTVGDLYDLIVRNDPHAREAARACLTQVAFYRLRHALAEMGATGRLTPTSPASIILSLDRSVPFRRTWDQLQKRAGVTLPRREVWTRMPRWLSSPLRGPWAYIRGMLVIALLFYGPAFALTMVSGMSFPSALLTLFFGIPIGVLTVSITTHFFFATMPRRIETLGDLAREAAGCSFVELRQAKGGFSPHDLWFALLAILRDTSGFVGSIDRETTFFPWTAKA